MIVVAVCQETLRWAIPSRGNVLCKGWLRVNTATGAKVCQFYLIVLYQNVLSANDYLGELTA
jgi:hypothetical protein